MLSRVKQSVSKRLSQTKRVVKGAQSIFNGLDFERAEARRKVWEGLPAVTQSEKHQWLGVISTGCGATHNVLERCDFYCTACYLSDEANHTPPLPFEEVKKQLDTIREQLGPSANTQITAGEVTLLPRADLIRIVKYAISIGLDPMVMTHGQHFLNDPTYLHDLMREGGLQKISVHIDTTQKGRKFLKKGMREKDLHPLRDQFANMIREARKITGLTLHAAHSLTITEDNFDDIADVMWWCERNNDAFRMFSFQPTADVGRTRATEQINQRDEIWSRICHHMPHGPANQHTFMLGHRDCNTTSLLWVVRFNGEHKLMEIKRDGAAIDEWFFDEVMNSAFNGFYADGVDNAVLLGKWLAMFAKSPKYIWQWPAYSAYRSWGDRDWVPRFVKTVLTGGEWSVTPLVIIVHNFMSRDEIPTAKGQERLKACAFKLPVEIDGHMQMVSMCEMNATELRKKTNLGVQELLQITRNPQSPAPAAAE